MTDSPRVSIVTPVLNRRRLLEATLRSVRGQTYGDVEHIVVDGGSTDGTLDVIRAFESTYNLRWTSGRDGGMYNAINKGLAMATGDVVAYLNSDDLYFPWTVATVVRAFAREPEAAFLFGDAAKVDMATGRHELYFQAPFDIDFIRRIGFLTQPAVFMRRAAYEAVGPFDESLRFVADCEYWMRAGARHRFVKVDEVLAIERNHEATLREQQASAVALELAAVRARFGRESGRSDLVLRLRNQVSLAANLLRFGLQASLFARLRGGAWRELLNARRGDIRTRWIPVRLIPVFGRRVDDRLLRPASTWVEP